MPIWFYTNNEHQIRREATIQLAMLRKSALRQKAQVLNHDNQLVNLPAEVMQHIWSFVPANGQTLYDKWKLAVTAGLDHGTTTNNAMKQLHLLLRKLFGVYVNISWERYMPLIIHVESQFSPHQSWIYHLDIPYGSGIAPRSIAAESFSHIVERLVHTLRHVIGHQIRPCPLHFLESVVALQEALQFNWTLRNNLITQWMKEVQWEVQRIRDPLSCMVATRCCMSCDVCHDHYIFYS